MSGLHYGNHWEIMYIVKKKETQVSVRVAPDLKAKLEHLSEYYGLSVTSLVHSYIVRAVRKEEQATPEAFENNNASGLPTAEIHITRQDKVKKNQSSTR